MTIDGNKNPLIYKNIKEAKNISDNNKDGLKVLVVDLQGNVLYRDIADISGGGGEPQDLQSILTTGNTSNDIYIHIYDGNKYMEYGGSGIYNYQADDSIYTNLLFDRTAIGGIQYRFDPDKLAGDYIISTIDNIEILGDILPTYIDNATAIIGGLTTNMAYKTPTGDVKVVI